MNGDFNYENYQMFYEDKDDEEDEDGNWEGDRSNDGTGGNENRSEKPQGRSDGAGTERSGS